jgi:hypothetical protein
MKLSTGMLFVTLIAGNALAQIPNVIQHVQDQMNGVQQQKKAASDDALSGNTATKAPAGKPAAATAAKSSAAPAASKPAATVAQKSPAPAAPKPSVAQAKPATAPASASVKAAPVVAAAASAKHDPFTKTAAPKTAKQAVVAVAKKPEAKKPEAQSAAAEVAPADTESKEDVAEKKRESGYITAGNRRDPFVSPIVQHMTGTGCSTGKRCLAIDQIALRGIVKSDGGMIAVVVNSLDKAYFLRENDPVFNGYVLKISGDTVVFKETVQDKLGHLSTREVVKKITTPAV